MKIGQMSNYITRHYFSEGRSERGYGLLFLGAPGVGKSLNVDDAAKKIAKQLGKEFTKVVVRWSSEKKAFVINGGKGLEEVLAEADKYFIFTDFRLSTIEPSDLSGIPRSREGITYYDPLLWAVLHSAAPGILFLDELTWIQREDVWAITPQLVLDKVAGLTAFSKETLVIAAGNRPEDGSIVRLIHNPLLNRFKIIKITSPTINEWAGWMDERYGDEWEKKTYAFLIRFQDDDYLLQVPKTPEGLENFPTPRSWTWASLDIKGGFGGLEDVCGLVGEEVGRKFRAFLDIDVDLEDLMRSPEKFAGLPFDAKYAVPIMLASWVGQNPDKVEGAFPLMDAMSGERHEFTVMTCISLGKRRLLDFLKRLFAYDPKYKEDLTEITEGIFDQIAPSR